MPEVEYAVDIWDLSKRDPRPDAEELHKQLRRFGNEGWELVSISFNLDLARHVQSHLLIFRRSSTSHV